MPVWPVIAGNRSQPGVQYGVGIRPGEGYHPRVMTAPTRP